MSSEEIYKNNPLHGVKLEVVLQELVDQYDWDILFAYMNLNCFKTNPSITSSAKFLRKTEWAKEKVEAFYLYQYKSMPKADDSQYELPPRDRIIPLGIVPRAPRELTLEGAEQIRVKKAKVNRDRASGNSNNPWGNS
jgi:uncharacterized protein (DUF2132 family)